MHPQKFIRKDVSVMKSNFQCVFIRYLVIISILISIVCPCVADILPVADRTPQVRDAIITAAGVESAVAVTETHLTAITSLNLRDKAITKLKSGDFSGLTGLTNLNLYGNELSSLPDGIFEGLTALTTLRLGGNTVDPLPITVTLEKVGEDQIKAVVPTGAPSDIVLPISATNGNISDDTTSLTISIGTVESGTVSISRTDGTTAAVTANIGTLPSLPNNHYGYTLSKSDALPLEIISAVSTAPETPDESQTPEETETTTPTESTETTENTAPMFSDGSITTRSISENSAADVNIGGVVSATDTENNTLTYSLSGVDADSFNLDDTTGQLKTKAALDYETKRVYTVTVTVSDGSLTDSINVIISIIDVDETPYVSKFLAVSERTSQVQDAIIEAVPGISVAADITDSHLATITSLYLRNAGITELKTGDFSGLTALTNLNLYGNMLSSLPAGIFDGLTALTSLRIGGNTVDPLPLIVSLQQVTNNQFQVSVHTAAPFDIVLPITVTNGSLSDGSPTITIPIGSVKSGTFTVVPSNLTSTTSVAIGELPGLPTLHYGYTLAKSAVCNRTTQVADAIAAAVPGANDCNNVSDADLATITSLDLSDMSITSLDSNDFLGLYSLTSLNLSNNQLQSLPDGFFSDLTSITSLNLDGNTVDPLQLTISLEKVGENQIKVAIPTGAPYDIVLPITVVNGSLSNDMTTITIPKTDVESQAVTITRTQGTTGAVTVDFDILPTLPSSHSGYALSKTRTIPLVIFPPLNTAPVFTEGVDTTRSVAERTDAGENIGNPVSATDAENDTLTYTLSGTDADAFRIDNTTGQLKTETELDYETKTSYSVTITVTDGSLSTSIDITIEITDIDDNRAPVFSDGESTTRITAENTTSGVDIGSAVSATDPDEDKLTYSISGTDATSFTLDTTTGQLRTNVSLDYETKSTYSVTITVSDGEYSNSIEVTINITDIDETVEVKDLNDTNNAPIFTEGDSTTRAIAENTGSGVDIGNSVSATDADKDTLTYSLSGTNASSFSIESTTGQLRTMASLDYETKTSYTVTITVSDGNEGTDSITVTINIVDVVEIINSAPLFTEGDSTSRTIAENSGSGVDIGSAISATDVDQDDILTYGLSGTDATTFSIDSSSGQLRTSASLDYETKSSYIVTITVSDGQGGSDTITVTINITDIDETTNSPPVFTDGNDTSRTIAENTGSGVDIGIAVSATDTNNDTLTYSLDGTDAATFSVDSSSGQLRTKTSLDYETKSSYTVTITVSDGQGGSDTITVTINITDVDETPANNDPVFTEGTSTSRTVAENTESNVDIGSAISATDVDDDTLTYSLIGTDSSSFSIENSSGQLRTNAALDYETKTIYEVTVSVSDGQGGNASITVTINIGNINEAPTFTDGTSTTRTIAENAGTNINIGSAVSASDEDGDTLTYTLDGTDADSFSIEPATGQLKTKVALDFETKSTYSVIVNVTDGSLTDSISVTITVRDLDETPSNIAPVFTEGEEATRIIPENTAPDNEIGSAITATDEDSENLVYLLSGTDASSFSIDTDTGQLITSAALNYEEKTSYEVTVTVSDGTLEDEITVTINVTNVNEAPVFNDGENTSRFVDENTATGTPFGRVVEATDPDADDTLTYSLEGTDADSFDIVGTTGKLQTKEALDYETKDEYTVTVIVTDSGDATATITVTIRIRDVNENRAPVFDDTDNTREIPENTGQGVNIGDPVEADDPDTDDTLEYTLSGTDGGSFSIDSTSGQLRTHVALDYEDKDMYTVIVSVSDGNGGTDEITITINVTDVDENRAPVFDDTDNTREIAENTGQGVNIGDPVEATDPDTGDTLEYTLSGTNATSFSIDSTSGQLRTKDALDYEEKDMYTVTVSVTDGNGGTDEITITINVTDVQENRAPTFNNATTTREVAENTGSGLDIGDPVEATDPDTNDTLKYSLGGINARAFSIDSTSGQLRTNVPLDYETKSSYSLTVTATDTSDETAQITVNISVTDVNEAPSFTESSPASRSVPENTSSGMNIGSAFDASDPDSGDSLTYGIGGTDAASFSIDSSTGQLKTKDALDHETKDAYEVTVFVSDDDNLSASITVNISVTDVNEAPLFTESSPASRSIAEETSAGMNIGDPVAATDPDGDSLTYSLSGTNSDAFSIVDSSGQLQTKDALDYETKNTYTVIVTATDDSGETNNSATITVNITVTDVTENRAPEFSLSSTSFRISDIESVSAGDNIGTAFTATDPDNDTLTYSLDATDADASLFDIVSSSGQLQATTSLINDSRSTYSITIIANDNNGGTDSIDVTVYVTRVSQQVTNNAPEFEDGTSTTRYIAENTASGVNIGDPISATDDDTGDTLTYSLSGTNATSFSIVSTTGQLQTSAALDYETKTSYEVTVTVRDDSGASNNTDTITVTINVTDVDESITPLSDRTGHVRRAIVGAIDGVDNAADVTAEHLASITSLTINVTRLTTFKVGDFDGLTGITELDLSHNLDLTTLPSGIFDGLSNLEILDFQLCKLTSLPSDVFNGLSALKELKLNGNYLTSLSSSIFNGLTSLKLLMLGNNEELGSIPANIFDDLTSLEELSLCCCNLTSLPSGVFDELSSLKFLWLGDNSFSLTSNMFDELSTLEALDISELLVASIPSGTFDELTSLKRLYLYDNNLSSLQADLFTQLTNLEVLDLEGNELRSLPDGIFSGLTNLSKLYLFYNPSINPADLSIPVGLEKISNTGTSTADFKAVVPIGAPFDIVLPIDIANGTLSGGATSITISTGSVESASYTVTNNSNGNVYASIGNLPSIPSGHDGYRLTKGPRIRLIVAENAAPVFNDGSSTSRSIAENTAAGVNIGDPISATDTDPDDTLTYSLSGTDADSFSIVDTSGQLQTKASLDYETKSTYTVTVTVTDDSGVSNNSDTITVTINVTDFDETLPRVALSDRTPKIAAGIRWELYKLLDYTPNPVTNGHLKLITYFNLRVSGVPSIKAGDFNGLTSMNELALSGNSISSVPAQVFKNLTNLTNLDMSGNGISSISAGVFDDLTNLTNLDLNENGLSSLPDDIFDELTKLNTLNLNNNTSLSLQSDIFDNLTALKTLSLWRIGMSSIPEGLFDELSNLTQLDLTGNGLTSLSSDVFQGLTSLNRLYLASNSLRELPEGIFEGLSSLTSVHLYSNRRANFPMTLSLEKVSDGEFKAKVDTGAIFDLVLPVTVSNGSIDGGATSITIPAGNVESNDSLNVTRTTGTSAAVTVNIGTLPSLGTAEPGLYHVWEALQFVRSDDLPLEVIPAVGGAPNRAQQIPNKTTFLPNYPNPFNPETWLPYQLAKPADVTLTIYNMRGVVVRELSFGHKPAGYYTNRVRAAYWDGRNAFGEKVATGVYFCTFKAGDFTATRKMLIRK